MVLPAEVTGKSFAENIMSENPNINSNLNNNTDMVQNNNFPQVPTPAWNDFSSPGLPPGNVATASPFMPSHSEKSPFSNFTFTSPTQVNSPPQSAHVSSPSFPISFSVPNQNPQNVVPGAGVSWQHALPSLSLPTNFGCSNKLSGPDRQQCSDFDGGKMPKPDHTSRFWPQPSCSSFRFEPQPSCSSQPRRPKRHYDYTAEGDIPSNKVYISEEKMTKRMRDLFIADKNPSDFSCRNRCDALTDELHRPYCTQNMKNRWKNFEKLEKSLGNSMEGDAQKDKEEASEKDDQPKFVLHQNISKDIFNRKPLLPKKIIEDIMKPTMEIVLWKPPGDIVKDAVQSVIERATNDNRINHQIDKSLSAESSITPQLSSLPVSSESSFTSPERNIIPAENVDVDMFDRVDDDMDL